LRATACDNSITSNAGAKSQKSFKEISKADKSSRDLHNNNTDTALMDRLGKEREVKVPYLQCYQNIIKFRSRVSKQRVIPEVTLGDKRSITRRVLAKFPECFLEISYAGGKRMRDEWVVMKRLLSQHTWEK
jgi:hypothetical protein